MIAHAPKLNSVSRVGLSVVALCLRSVNVCLMDTQVEVEVIDHGVKKTVLKEVEVSD